MTRRKHLILRYRLVFIITLLIVNLSVFGVLGYEDFSTIQPAFAQRISPGELWRAVYERLPNIPKENQYISRETRKVAIDDTLIRRLIHYHVYIKQRSPAYRFDWKLTLADYLNANEPIYVATYPGNGSLRQNPLPGDRAAITKLTRQERNQLVQVLVDIFRSPEESVSQPQQRHFPN